jgi:hypothetical protein
VEDILEKLGDEYGTGHTWAKEQSGKLKVAKRYLKGDYNLVNLFILTQEKVLNRKARENTICVERN